MVLLAIGPFERSTGIDAIAEATTDLLSRRSIWFFLRLTRLFGRPVVDILVARDGSGMAGTGLVVWLPHVAYVANMATRTEMRGRGIASQILALQQGEARRRRRPWMALDVEGENETAQRVYRRAGYHDAGSCRWFTRTGLPSTGGARGTPGTRVVARSDYAELARKLDASRPADYRSAFPAGQRLLHHNEFLVRGGRVERRTWRVDASDGRFAVVRAYYLRGASMGVYFPMTTHPGTSPEEILGGVDAATEWLRSFGPARCLAMVSEPKEAVAIALEQRGFSSVVSTLTMLRRVSGGDEVRPEASRAAV
jgi:GNAT superfamily N-acetyltransferase